MSRQDVYAVLIPGKLYERIREIARERGVSANDVYSHVIEHGLENYLMDDERRALVGIDDIMGVVLGQEDSSEGYWAL